VDVNDVLAGTKIMRSIQVCFGVVDWTDWEGENGVV
jgi:hypothetical protein